METITLSISNKCKINGCKTASEHLESEQETLAAFGKNNFNAYDT